MNWCILAPPECPTPSEIKKNYLEKEQYLSEFSTEADLNLVRHNLNVPSKDTIYTKEETESRINDIVQKAIDESLENLDKKMSWVTSGPIETTVGFMEDNQNLPAQMSIQKIFDSIFYDRRVYIEGPTKVDSEAIYTLYASTNLMIKAELFLNGTLYKNIAIREFVQDSVEVLVKPITNNTLLTFKVTYPNDIIFEDSLTINADTPVFVGVLPEQTIPSTNLNNLVSLNPNNQLIDGYQETLTVDFDFEDLGYITLLLPTDHPELKSMSTSIQSFGVEAFSKTRVLIKLPNNANVQYIAYIYGQPLAGVSLTITFKFK